MNFTNINDIKLDNIIEYCQKENQVEWLKAVALAEDKVGKDGKARKVSFIEIRNEFCRKFFPEIAPKKHSAKPSMYDIIKNL